MAGSEQAVSDLHAMARLRAFEERVLELWVEKLVVGSVHLDIGQEAIPVGVASVLRPEDALFATYRGHGYALAVGTPAEALFAELLGRATGINGGRGGSAYLSAPDYGFYGENSIVGAGAPIACGAALAGRYDGSGRVAVTVFGDGAMNQGSVHEAMNFASAMRLPVVFICVNNGWSELTPIADMVADPELHKRAAAYAMPGRRIDGNDPAVVRAAMSEAVELARSGQGPALIEAVTQRLVGHYIGDAEVYRRPGELDQAKAREPLVVLGERLAAAGIEPQPIIDRAREEIEEAAAAALAAPLASPETAKEHVYA